VKRCFGFVLIDLGVEPLVASWEDQERYGFCYRAGGVIYWQEDPVF
jgi:hypothetical protein